VSTSNDAKDSGENTTTAITKENFGYSILYLIPILGVVYGLLWWVAKVDPFFFKIMFERIKLKTKGNNKHGGNYYE
jgi:hypothetical protein